MKLPLRSSREYTNIQQSADFELLQPTLIQSVAVHYYQILNTKRLVVEQQRTVEVNGKPGVNIDEQREGDNDIKGEIPLYEPQPENNSDPGSFHFDYITTTIIIIISLSLISFSGRRIFKNDFLQLGDEFKNSSLRYFEKLFFTHSFGRSTTLHLRVRTHVTLYYISVVRLKNKATYATIILYYEFENYI